MSCIRLAILTLLAMPLVGQSTTMEKVKPTAVTQANDSIANFRVKAEQGDARAQFNLGLCYDKGHGVPRDYAEAVKWYRKAADQGLAVAQSNLGACYVKGQGIPQDYVEAVKWWRTAANQGVAGAQFNLARCYAIGQGVQRDRVKAYVWFSLSAANGNTEAVNLRDISAQGLTPLVLKKAQARAKKLHAEIQAWERLDDLMHASWPN